MPTHIENTQFLLDLVKAEPVQRLDLGSWSSPCGTIHCIGGLAATHPHFQSLGLTLRRSLRGDSILEFEGGSVTDELFGAGGELFAPRGYGREQIVRLPGWPAKTDKEIAIWRLENHLEYLKAQE